jgi:hypothetical protein
MLASLNSPPEMTEASRMLEEAAGPVEQLAEAESSIEIPGDNNNWVKLRTVLATYAVNHPAVLRAALERAPESTKPALRRAIAVSIAGYERVLKTLD